MGNMEKQESFNAPYKRQTWAKSWDFIFTAAGCSIGLGNVWRFPYLCFKSGGGAFLIPYFLFAILIGIPLVILETSLGQSVRLGLTKSWGTVPIFKGLAFANVVILLHANVFYVVILAWSFKYLVGSFSSVLPWTTCDNSWNTANCVNVASLNASRIANESNSVNVTDGNVTTGNVTALTSAAEEYWNLEMLGISPGIEHMGKLRLDLALYLILIWLGVYLCTFKGIKWSAKIVYVTATLPIFLIVVILIRGATLEGAANGVGYYLTPNITKLSHPEVWVGAGTQVIYSYGACAGNLITLGSYNKYHHDLLRDSILIGVLNIGTSFISGFAVFSTLGFMAHYQNTTLEEVAKSGPGLVFVAYPEALSLLPLPQFWCALFFLMIIFLGFDSEFVYQECVLAFFMDNFPKIRTFRYGREIFHAVLCGFMLIIGLLMVTEGGVYLFEIYNHFAIAGWCQFFIAACEFVAVGWLIGANRHWMEIKRMVGSRRGKRLIVVAWKFIGPVACVALSIYYMALLRPLRYHSYVYPVWAQVFAQFISLSSVSMIPAYAIYKVVKTLRNGGKLSELRYRPINGNAMETEDFQTMVPIVSKAETSYSPT
uniref:Transporter n=1 Tax=Phallusia mammillata TaxID=59560 RepID=A0A6F9DS78_9ASCI|nr:sodium- and chloride-dependent GABA transporter 1-like [Phallusia mammillata]